MTVSQVNSTGYIKKTERQHTFHIGRYSIMIHSLLLKMKARQIHIMSQNNDRIVSDLLFYCHLGTCQNQLCATPLKKKRNKSLPCSVLSKLFNNGSRAISDALIYHLYVLVKWFYLKKFNLFSKWGITVVCNEIRKA